MDPDKIFLVEVADMPGGNLDFLEVSRSFRLFPGEGVTPIPSFMKQVAKTGYSGIYSVEVFNTYYQTQDVNAVARRAMASLRPLLEA
jgi:4-hydroxyphenylpyruvate dioxygenase